MKRNRGIEKVQKQRRRKMVNNILQANINHSRNGHDILMQSMVERDFSIAVVSEPYAIPRNHPHWVSNDRKTIAITWRQKQNAIPCTPLMKGNHFVAIRWGEMAVIGTYLPPSLDIADFEEALEELEHWISQILEKPTIVAGDFNSKSAMWQSPITNQRGILVEEWASRLGLCCLNRGGRSTCIKNFGESIIDLTFANPAAALGISWVVSDRESMSDHRYIEIITRQTKMQNTKSRLPQQKRWAIKKINEDLFKAAITIGCWNRHSIMEERDTEVLAEKLRNIVAKACNVSMPQIKLKARRAMPWWSDELRNLRSELTASRRRLSRIRRRPTFNQDDTEAHILLGEYRQARDNFSKALRKAKAKSWEEFVLSLNEDPWGRPYKSVLDKLRRWTPPYTESMEGDILERVLSGLFPADAHGGDNWIEPALPEEGASAWKEEYAVSQEELNGAIKRMMAKNAAPGLSGITAKSWALASTEMAMEMKGLFTECLKKGKFPEIWKNAKLVLLRKPGKPDDQAAGYKPISLMTRQRFLKELS